MLTSLRAKGLAVAIGVLLVLGVIALLSVNEIANVQVRGASHAATSRVTIALERAIESKAKQLSLSTRLAAERPGTRTIFEADAATICDHLKEIRTLVGDDELMVVGTDSKVEGATDKFIETGSDVHDAFGINQVLQGKPWQGAQRLDGRLLIAASEPMRVGDYVQACLTACIFVDSSFTQEVGRLSGVELEISDRGKILGSTLNGMAVPDAHGLWRKDIHGEPYVGQQVDFKLRGLKNPIRLLVLLPEEPIVAPVHALRLGTLVVFGIAIVLGLLGTGAYAYVILDPLEKLTRCAQDIEAGKWPQPIESKRTDEFGLTLRVFDGMVAKVRENNERLLEMLQIDPLTQLWNQRSFRTKMEEWLKSSDRNPGGALILLDLDRFEHVNRELGSARADEILVQTAAICKARAGEDSIVGRMHADRFAILFTSPNPGECAEALRSDIESSVPVTASLGLATNVCNPDRSDLYLLAAKVAVEQAKQAGRNKVRFYESMSLVSDVEELRQFLRQGSYSAMRALAEAVDAKDEYTRGHSSRVAEYAKGIAQAANLDSGFVELIHVAGELHDVGKIGVPDMVLKKEGKLTDEEFEAVKKHPELGEKIVSQIPQLSDALPGIRSHHERWDGRGYPDLLAGEQIPYIARILAIADTYDAMTSDRPYRKGLSPETALNVIVQGAGTQFDPNLIEPFLQWHAGLADRLAA
jgi:diguanylate cyclase (GGDEF)-like protein